MMRKILLLTTVICGLGTGVVAQDNTLADIRQELNLVYVEIQRLKRELSTSGGVSVSVSGDTLQRVDLLEAEVRRLTSKTEQLEFRIGAVVRDGTNRIGDLEFRLCELEANCDIGALGQTSTLGGEVETPSTPNVQTQSDTTELAMGEQADFDRAVIALESGKFVEAAALFEAFTQTYTGGPLTSDAHFLRGAALEGDGQIAPAARAYLASFSGDPNGDRAPDALLRLGVSLGKLGQTNEACVTLGEVLARFPGSRADAEARGHLSDLNCT